MADSELDLYDAMIEPLRTAGVLWPSKVGLYALLACSGAGFVFGTMIVANAGVLHGVLPPVEVVERLMAMFLGGATLVSAILLLRQFLIVRYLESWLGPEPRTLSTGFVSSSAGNRRLRFHAWHKAKFLDAIRYCLEGHGMSQVVLEEFAVGEARENPTTVLVVDGLWGSPVPRRVTRLEPDRIDAPSSGVFRVDFSFLVARVRRVRIGEAIAVYEDEGRRFRSYRTSDEWTTVDFACVDGVNSGEIRGAMGVDVRREFG